jgi:23S rRNA pseudouridine955/2504/2580 synthase
MINLDDIEIIDEFEDDEPAVDPRKRGPLIGKIQIVDQAEDWVAINKPAFVPSLPERGKYTAQSVQEWAKNQWPDSILCHRIDRETSGLLLIAKNPEAYRHFSMQFEHRKVHKIYHAIVNGQLHFNDLWIDLPIIAEQLGKIRIDRKNGKPAQTRFKSLQVFKHFTLMECEPKTGRLHQIRVHLQSQNACIAADTLYGSDIPMLSWVKRKLHGTDTPLIQRFALHAKQMRIQAPDGTDLVLEAPYSKDMEVMLKHLNKYNQ